MWQVASAKAKLVQSKRVKFLPEEERLSLQPVFFFLLSEKKKRGKNEDDRAADLEDHAAGIR